MTEIPRGPPSTIKTQAQRKKKLLQELTNKQQLHSRQRISTFFPSFYTIPCILLIRITFIHSTTTLSCRLLLGNYKSHHLPPLTAYNRLFFTLLTRRIVVLTGPSTSRHHKRDSTFEVKMSKHPLFPFPLPRALFTLDSLC